MPNLLQNDARMCPEGASSKGVDTNTYHTSFYQCRLHMCSLSNGCSVATLQTHFPSCVCRVNSQHNQQNHRPRYNETVTKETRFPFLCHHRFITFRTSLTRKFPVKNVISIFNALTGKSPVKVGSGPLPRGPPR